MRGEGVSDEGRRGTIKTCSCESDDPGIARRGANPAESDTLMLMLCARRWVRAPALVLRGCPLSFPNVIELDATGAGAGGGGLRPATASAKVLLGRVAEGERMAGGAGLLESASGTTLGLGSSVDLAIDIVIVGTWISSLSHPSSSSCSSKIVARLLSTGGAWSLNDGCSAMRRGRGTTGGGRARWGIECEEDCIGFIAASRFGRGDGRERGVVGVVGMDDAVVAGDDMTRPEPAILKFSDSSSGSARRRACGRCTRECGCYVSD